MALLSGLLTPLVALIAVYIAWQQWRATKHKLLIDLFDRRYRSLERILSATNVATVKIMQSNAPTITVWLEEPSPLIECWRAAREAHLLFGDPRVDDVLQRLNKELSELAMSIADLRSIPDQVSHGEATKAIEHSTTVSSLQDELFRTMERHLMLNELT